MKNTAISSRGVDSSFNHSSARREVDATSSQQELIERSQVQAQEHPTRNRAREHQLQQQQQQPHHPRQQQEQQQEQQQLEQENHRRRQPGYNGAYISNILSGLTAMTSGRRIMQNIHPERQSSKWLATEMLKRTNLSSGDICMFHYPMDFFPSMEVDEMGKALEIILGGGRLTQQERGVEVHGEREDYGDPVVAQVVEGQHQGEAQQEQQDQVADAEVAPQRYASIPQVYLSNAMPDARNRITHIQFSWYHFPEFPRDVLGQTYANLQHLDIRQNASLKCIDSIISQLPHLISLNLSDCPNIRTILPLATSLEKPHVEGIVDDFEVQQVQEQPSHQRTLNLRHLWVRGCNLSSMSREEWAAVFDALAESSGPLERLTLSRNNMSYLHENIGKLQRLTYLFVEDNYDVNNDIIKGAKKIGPNSSFELPQELGDLSRLRFISLCGNNVTSLPRTMGRLNDNCDVYLHRNSNLTYPPPAYQKSIKTMRLFFHEERMKLLRGAVLFMPHCKRARWRANERLYRPGGWGYTVCKERFEESVRRTSITMMGDC